MGCRSGGALHLRTLFALGNAQQIFLLVALGGFCFWLLLLQNAFSLPDFYYWGQTKILINMNGWSVWSGSRIKTSGVFLFLVCPLLTLSLIIAAVMSP